MPLHIEQVITDLKNFVQTNLPAQLTTVLAEQTIGLPLGTPSPEDYFIGSRNRYRKYNTPAIFFMVPDTLRPGEGTQDEWGTILKQDHKVMAQITVEATDEETLTRMCWRLAQALDSCVHDQDITPSGVTTRTTKVFVPRISYDPSVISADQTTFRKDVWVYLTVRHWDLLTPLPIQAVGGSGAVVTIGTVGTATNIAASITDSLVATTNPTQMLVATPGKNGGNYAIDIYLRVVGSTTAVTVELDYTDNGNAQIEQPLMNSSLTVGSYSVGPRGFFFQAAQGAPITLLVTASVANQVYVTASLETLT